MLVASQCQEFAGTRVEHERTNFRSPQEVHHQSHGSASFYALGNQNPRFLLFKRAILPAIHNSTREPLRFLESERREQSPQPRPARLSAEVVESSNSNPSVTELSSDRCGSHPIQLCKSSHVRCAFRPMLAEGCRGLSKGRHVRE